jgi:hypothetical protein
MTELFPGQKVAACTPENTVIEHVERPAYNKGCTGMTSEVVKYHIKKYIKINDKAALFSRATSNLSTQSFDSKWYACMQHASLNSDWFSLFNASNDRIKRHAVHSKKTLNNCTPSPTVLTIS